MLIIRSAYRCRPILQVLLVVSFSSVWSGLNAQATPQPCPNQISPLAIADGTGRFDLRGRRQAEGDYFVIEWNESTRQAFWYDYRNRFKTTNFIDRNGSLLPILSTKEKIAVHVCGLHFGDQVTVTTNPLAIPEGGADIRGATAPTTATNLVAALDTVSTISTTGSTASGGSLGFGATQTLSLAPVNGIVPGSITARGADGTATYKDATITLSGEQTALLMYETYMNARVLQQNIHDFEVNQTPGSIQSIRDEIARDVRDFTRQHDNNLNDFAIFDEDVNSAQILANDLSNLGAAIAAQGFGARAVAIHNNYATLRGVLDLANTPCVNEEARKVTALEQAEQAKTDATTALKEAQAALEAAQKATKAAQQTPDAPAAQSTPSDKPLYRPIPSQQVQCDGAEQAAYRAFKKSYYTELHKLVMKLQDHPELHGEGVTKDSIVGWDPNQTFAAIFRLESILKDIDESAGNGVFKLLNDWYRESHVEQTDLLTPASGNALMRVSIVVQRGWVPFTLSSGPTPMGSSAPGASGGGGAGGNGAAAPSTGGSTTASTSTPAHAVKTFLIEIHRLANFNLAGGAALIKVPTSTYTLAPGTTNLATPCTVAVASTPSTCSPPNPAGCVPSATVACDAPWYGSCDGSALSVIPGSTSNSAPPPYYCISPAQRSNWQVSAVVGMVYYPFGHDYFPRRRGFSNYPRNYLPSLFVATSVNTLGNALAAFNFEPITGIDLFAGLGFANSARLDAATSPKALVTSATTSIPTDTRYGHGFSYGIAFDLGIFTSLFGKPSQASLP